jgi:hypothetical protein
MRTIFLLISFVLSVTTMAQEIPYKPEQEYTIRLDLKFLSRSSANTTEVKVSESREEYLKRNNSSQLPHLTLYITIKETNHGEVRMKIMRDGRVHTNNKKIELGKEFKLEVGYTDDAKDKVSGYNHTLLFLDASKKEVNKIVIAIEENGDYRINGEMRGRL